MINTEREILASVVGMDVTYEVHLKSDGSRSVGFAENTWFQVTPFIDRQFKTYDEAIEAISKYEMKMDGKYSYLTKRVVQVTTVAVVMVI